MLTAIAELAGHFRMPRAFGKSGQDNDPGQVAICYSHTVVYGLPVLVVCNESESGLHREKPTPQAPRSRQGQNIGFYQL